MRNGYFILSLLILAGLAGCSNNGGGPPALTPSELVTKGWQAYGGKNYPAALSDFKQAITLNSSYTDAYNGAGWAYAILGNPASSLLEFTAGRDRDSSNLDMRAGIAFVYNALKSYDLSLAQDTIVLSVNPNWVFSHDTSMNALDLHLLAAEDYFALGNYAASLVEVLILDNNNPEFVGLDVSSIGGQILLAEEIERLRTII